MRTNGAERANTKRVRSSTVFCLFNVLFARGNSKTRTTYIGNNNVDVHGALFNIHTLIYIHERAKQFTVLFSATCPKYARVPYKFDVIVIFFFF